MILAYNIMTVQGKKVIKIFKIIKIKIQNVN